MALIVFFCCTRGYQYCVMSFASTQDHFHALSDDFISQYSPRNEDYFVLTKIIAYMLALAILCKNTLTDSVRADDGGHDRFLNLTFAGPLNGYSSGPTWLIGHISKSSGSAPHSITTLPYGKRVPLVDCPFMPPHRFGITCHLPTFESS